MEFGQVAMCRGDSDFEVFHDMNYLEAIPLDDGEGSAVAVTSLYSRYIPLFRYMPGDNICGPKPLAHGHVASFKSIQGRVHDSVSLPGGQVLHSMAIFHCIHQESSVLNIQMILRDEGPQLRLAVTDGYTTDCEDRIRHRLTQVAPELQGIPIEVVGDIQTTRAGKRRWIQDERTKG